MLVLMSTTNVRQMHEDISRHTSYEWVKVGDDSNGDLKQISCWPNYKHWCMLERYVETTNVWKALDHPPLMETILHNGKDRGASYFLVGNQNHFCMVVYVEANLYEHLMVFMKRDHLSRNKHISVSLFRRLKISHMILYGRTLRRFFPNTLRHFDDISKKLTEQKKLVWMGPMGFQVILV